MTDSQPRCSIIIRCYNEEQHIGRLLAGIMEQTIKAEVIVVDSGSTDATVAIASQFPVRVVGIRPEEFSFGRSLNCGCRAATGEFLVMASAHVYPVYKDWLEHLLGPFQDPNVALVYGKQRGNKTTKYSEHRIFAKWFPDEPYPRQDHPFCNNANAAVRRAVWEQIPYDEGLTGLEDLAWAKEAMARGYQIAYEPEAVIIHVHQETPRRIYNRYRREAIALKQVFREERFNLWDFVRLTTANILSDWYHAFHDGVLFHNLLSVPVFRMCQYWGAFQGFRQHGPVTSKLKHRFYYPTGFSRGRRVRTQRDRLIVYSKDRKE